MGRPINKRYLGEPTVTGNEIKVQFFNGTASVNGWIVKQLGAKKFRCTDGTDTADCLLVDKLAAALIAGEMSISVRDDSAAVKQIVKIAGRKVTLGSGESIPWDFSSSTSDERVEVEEGGDQSALTISILDATAGVTYAIAVPGTTDFTLLGAADSTAATEFEMNDVTPEGTGTVTAVEDTFGL